MTAARGKLQEIPLFPLGAVLFPHSRMPLQVFEARYMDLVRHCMREGTGFGIVLINDGSEIYEPTNWQEPELMSIGCYAHIVDWDALPHGSLGLTVEGSGKFRLYSTRTDDHHQMYGMVEWILPEDDAPVPDSHASYHELLVKLLEHPQLKRLNIETRGESALHLGNQLAQMLPIPEHDKQFLLEIERPLERLDAIAHHINRLES